MSEKKYFGTDGIRGRAGGQLITPEFVLKLGWSLGKTLQETAIEKPKVLIGKDTRVSGYLFESALEAGLAAAGVDIHLMGPMPTPGVAYLTRTFRAQAGIVISASHNPYYDNGIKFFSADGFKLPDEMEHKIEHYLEQPLVMAESDQLGKAKRIDDAQGRYIEYCKSTIPPSYSFNNLKVVLDCANGATYAVAPHVFEELGMDVTVIHNHPDGFNINESCGSTKPESLIEKVKEEKADLGIAFDGDGDRVIMVDNKGRIVDGDELIYIIAHDRKLRDKLKGGVVGTVMTNYGLERAFSEEGIPFQRTQVGDRYVIESLREANWELGGEGSGHIICLNKTTTGDGIIAALQVLAAMHNQRSDLATLKDKLRLMPQVRINVPVEDAAAKIVKASTVSSAIETANKNLSGKGRVLVRPSGTEPLVRVMVEGDEEGVLQQNAEYLADVIRVAASEMDAAIQVSQAKS